jgi:hypothetical protein
MFIIISLPHFLHFAFLVFLLFIKLAEYNDEHFLLQHFLYLPFLYCVFVNVSSYFFPQVKHLKL